MNLNPDTFPHDTQYRRQDEGAAQSVVDLRPAPQTNAGRGVEILLGLLCVGAAIALLDTPDTRNIVGSTVGALAFFVLFAFSAYRLLVGRRNARTPRPGLAKPRLVEYRDGKPLYAYSEISDAPHGLRFLAYVLDSFAISAFIFFVLFALIGTRLFRDVLDPTWAPVLGILSNFLYFGYSWAILDGQTIGKALLGLRVVRTDAEPITTMTAIKRFVGYFVNTLFLGLGWFRLLFGRDRRGYHDTLANTLVVQVRKEEMPPPIRPRTQIIAGTLLTPVFAGLMVATNWVRFGRRQSVWLPILGGMGVFIALNALIPATVDLGGRLLLNVAAGLLFSLVFVARQKADYENWLQANNHARPKIAETGILDLSVIVVLGGLALYIQVWAVSISGPTNSMVFSYVPASWWVDNALCEAANVSEIQCLGGIRGPRVATVFHHSAKASVLAIILSAGEVTKGFSDPETRTLTIGRDSAFEITGEVDGNPLQVIYVQRRTGVLVVSILPNSSSDIERHRLEIHRIIVGVRLE